MDRGHWLSYINKALQSILVTSTSSLRHTDSKLPRVTSDLELYEEKNIIGSAASERSGHIDSAFLCHPGRPQKPPEELLAVFFASAMADLASRDEGRGIGFRV